MAWKKKNNASHHLVFRLVKLPFPSIIIWSQPFRQESGSNRLCLSSLSAEWKSPALCFLRLAVLSRDTPISSIFGDYPCCESVDRKACVRYSPVRKSKRSKSSTTIKRRGVTPLRNRFFRFIMATPSALPPFPFDPTRVRSYVVRLPLFTRLVLLVIVAFLLLEIQSVWSVVRWGALVPDEMGIRGSKVSPHMFLP